MPPDNTVKGCPCVTAVIAPKTASSIPAKIFAFKRSPKSQAASSSVSTGFTATTTAALPAGIACKPSMKNTA